MVNRRSEKGQNVRDQMRQGTQGPNNDFKWEIWTTVMDWREMGQSHEVRPKWGTSSMLHSHFYVPHVRASVVTIPPQCSPPQGGAHFSIVGIPGENSGALSGDFADKPLWTPSRLRKVHPPWHGPSGKNWGRWTRVWANVATKSLLQQIKTLKWENERLRLWRRDSKWGTL